jgi:tetratricopeptide (TPR) repeat protein
LGVTLDTLEDRRDNDNDGLTNEEERSRGTDLNNPDTDGDGVIDSIDYYAGDSERTITIEEHNKRIAEEQQRNRELREEKLKEQQKAKEYFNLGLNEDNHYEAIEYYEKCIKIGNLEYLEKCGYNLAVETYNLGLDYKREGEIEEGNQLIQKAKEISPRFADTLKKPQQKKSQPKSTSDIDSILNQYCQSECNRLFPYDDMEYTACVMSCVLG